MSMKYIPWALVLLLTILLILVWRNGNVQPPPFHEPLLAAKVPAAAPPAARSWSKMDFYEQAAQDSAKFQAVIKADQQAVVSKDTSSMRVYKSLSHLRQALQTPPPP